MEFNLTPEAFTASKSLTHDSMIDFVNPFQDILVLFATQTGNAQDVAERIGREVTVLKHLRSHFNNYVKPIPNNKDENQIVGSANLSSLPHVPPPVSYSPICPCRVLNIEGFDALSLTQEKFVIFVTSTTGEGAAPDGMQAFWKVLLRKNLPSTFLSSLKFAVFGLGDSGYNDKFNAAARKMDARLNSLGGHRLCSVGLGDDQHSIGYEGALIPWLSSLWTSLFYGDLDPLFSRILPPSPSPSPFPLPPATQAPQRLKERRTALKSLLDPFLDNPIATSAVHPPKIQIKVLRMGAANGSSVDENSMEVEGEKEGERESNAAVRKGTNKEINGETSWKEEAEDNVKAIQAKIEKLKSHSFRRSLIAVGRIVGFKLKEKRKNEEIKPSLSFTSNSNSTAQSSSVPNAISLLPSKALEYFLGIPEGESERDHGGGEDGGKEGGNSEDEKCFDSCMHLPDGYDEAEFERAFETFLAGISKWLNGDKNDEELVHDKLLNATNETCRNTLRNSFMAYVAYVQRIQDASDAHFIISSLRKSSRGNLGINSINHFNSKNNESLISSNSTDGHAQSSVTSSDHQISEPSRYPLCYSLATVDLNTRVTSETHFQDTRQLDISVHLSLGCGRKGMDETSQDKLLLDSRGVNKDETYLGVRHLDNDKTRPMEVEKKEVKNWSIFEEDEAPYQPGDAVAILPMPCTAKTVAFLQRIGVAYDAWVVVQTAEEKGLNTPSFFMSARALVQGCLDIDNASPRRYFFQVIRQFISPSCVTSPPPSSLSLPPPPFPSPAPASTSQEAARMELENDRLQYYGSAEGMEDLYRYNQREGRTVMEVLSDFTTVRHVPLAWILEAAPALKPRLYSIASSALEDEGVKVWNERGSEIGGLSERRDTSLSASSSSLAASSHLSTQETSCVMDVALSLLVALVKFKTLFGREKRGLASSFIQDALATAPASSSTLSLNPIISVWIQRPFPDSPGFQAGFRMPRKAPLSLVGSQSMPSDSSHNDQCNFGESNRHVSCKTPSTRVPPPVADGSGFRIPRDLSIPLILVGPGTGVAPLRAFLRERLAVKRHLERLLGVEGGDGGEGHKREQGREGIWEDEGVFSSAREDPSLKTEILKVMDYLVPVSFSSSSSSSSLTPRVIHIAPSVIFFGCRHPSKDLYFASEWREFERSSILLSRNGFTPAFSRPESSDVDRGVETEGRGRGEGEKGQGLLGNKEGNQRFKVEGKAYVSDKIRKDKTRLWDLLSSQNAAIYVSGNAGKMPQGVAAAFVDVVLEGGRSQGIDKAVAEQFVKRLAVVKRYHVEAWS